jgi:hypothetical protein
MCIIYLPMIALRFLQKSNLKKTIDTTKMDCVVLEEEIDIDYEPTQKEILEYAEWLGMDIHSDKDLLWIAREGLKVRKTLLRIRYEKTTTTNITGTSTHKLETMQMQKFG